MARGKAPSTPAVRALRQSGVAFSEHLYSYEAHGGTRVAARELGVDEHCVVKTLVLQDEAGKPLLVLMPGNREVSTKQLARLLGVKQVSPCEPAVAQRHSGYQVGGTAPFGTRHPLPVYLEREVLALERVYVNGGSRGFLVGLTPGDLLRVLQATLVEVGIAG